MAGPDPPRADDVFRQSEMLFRSMVENAHDVIAMADADGRVLYISPAVAQYGRTVEECIGNTAFDLIHPDDQDRVKRLFEQLLERPGDTIHFDVRVADAFGNWREKEVTMRNLLRHHSVLAVIVNVHDIAERKKAERELQQAHDLLEQRVVQRTEELRKSEARFRRLVEGLRVDYIFFSQDRDQVMRYVSPSVINVLGYTPDEIVGHRFDRHLTDNPINQQNHGSFEKALVGGYPAHCLCEARHADGSTRFLEYLDVPVFNDAGEVVAVEGIARDVTKRRQAEAALQKANDELEHRVEERTADLKQLNLQLWGEIKKREESEKLFRSIVEDQTEFIVRWHPDGCRTFVNSSYCRFFGKTRAELIGTSFFPLIADERDRQIVRERTREVTPENPVATYEHQVNCPDNKLRWTQWNDRAFFNDHGELTGFQSVGRDITEQKEAAEKLLRQHDELAHVARISLMGEMVAAIAHELGQPLHAISTFASASIKAIESESESREQKLADWAAKIQKQVTRADGIIRRLRRFGRAEQTTQEHVDINNVLLESMEMVADLLKRSGVRGKTELGHGLPTVLADRLQLEQVVVNLLKNGCESMNESPPKDRTLVTRSYVDQGGIRVDIRDRGCGMTEESSERAFTSFFTTKPDGVGIGLVISRRIIEEHHGRLFCQPNPTGGMTFSFWLPLGGCEGEE